MKKALLLFAFVTVSLTAFSQIKVRPGVRLGLNAATISNMDNAERKLGINAATYVNIHFSNFYELQVEGTYNNQGSTQTYQVYNGFDPSLGHTREVDLNLHYVGVGIVNKFFIIPDVGLHFILGPSLEVNVDDDGADITPIDFSLFGGIGYEFPFGLGLEARYKQGLIDVRENYDGSYYIGNDYYYAENDGDYYDGNNLLNGVIQFGVYYKFNF